MSTPQAGKLLVIPHNNNFKGKRNYSSLSHFSFIILYEWHINKAYGKINRRVYDIFALV